MKNKLRLRLLNHCKIDRAFFKYWMLSSCSLFLLLISNFVWAEATKVTTESPAKNQDYDKAEDLPDAVDTPVHHFNEDEKVSDEFAWTGIGGWRVDKDKYLVEIHGILKRGRIVNRSSYLQKLDQKTWKTLDIQSTASDDQPTLEFEKPKFTYAFVLPSGRYRLHTVVKAGQQQEDYDVEFETSPNWLPVPPPALPLYLCDKCFYLSGGPNYLNYAQAAPVATLRPINYASTVLGSFALDGRLALSRKAALRFEAHRHEGADIGKNYVLDNHKVLWTYLTLGGDYINKINGKLLGLKYSTGYVYAFQAHKMPFLIQAKTGNYSIDTINLYSVGGGGFAGVSLGSSELTAMLRVQAAVAGVGLVKLNGGFSFDGSLYLFNSLGKSSYWGFTWGGQYHNYAYKLSDSSSKGNYSMIVSAFSLVFGHSFGAP